MSRWINLLPLRGCLACLVPSWGRHPLLGGRGLHLMEARSSRSPWLSQPPTAPTDTGSGQQVLRSGGPEVCPSVLGQLEAVLVVGISVEVPHPQRSWPWSWGKRPWSHSSSSGASTMPMPDWESGKVHWSTYTFCRL